MIKYEKYELKWKLWEEAFIWFVSFCIFWHLLLYLSGFLFQRIDIDLSFILIQIHAF